MMPIGYTGPAKIVLPDGTETKVMITHTRVYRERIQVGLNEFVPGRASASGEFEVDEPVE